MIRLKRLCRTYPGRRDTPAVLAVDGIDLAVTKGELVVITGRSGSGKTTLLNLASGLARPSSGTVALDRIDLASLSDRERARFRARTTGFVFQFPSLLSALTVLENVLFAVLVRGSESLPDDQKRAYELLSLVGLRSKIHARPHELSAGEQQRVVIARALFGRPKILFADEPTSNLDERTEDEIMELLTRVHRESGLTTMIVTHSSALVRYANRAIVMQAGRASTAAPG